MPRFTRIGAFFVLVATLALAPSLSARAASSSWTGDQRARVRIITATNGVPGSTLQIGVEFRYPNGWHPICSGLEENAFEVIRCGEARVLIIAPNRNDPAALDRRFAGMKAALEDSVRDHSAL